MKPVLVLSACLLCPALALQPGVPDPKPTFVRYGTDSETGISVWRFDWTGTDGWTYFNLCGISCGGSVPSSLGPP